MNCPDVQPLLSEYAADQLTGARQNAVRDHVAECLECREALAFHRRLTERLDGEFVAPSLLRDRVESHLSQTKRKAWLGGNLTMKKLALSAAAAVALATLIFVAPKSASASTPKQELQRMGLAIAAVAQRGGLEVFVKANKDGTLDVEARLDDQPLPDTFPIETLVVRNGEVLDVELRLDFDPAKYAEVKFGKKSNVLELRLAGQKTGSIVEIDPKTALPTSWSADRLSTKTVEGMPLNQEKFELRLREVQLGERLTEVREDGKPSSVPGVSGVPAKDVVEVRGRPLTYKMNVKIKMNIGQEARVKVQPQLG